MRPTADSGKSARRSPSYRSQDLRPPSGCTHGLFACQVASSIERTPITVDYVGPHIWSSIPGKCAIRSARRRLPVIQERGGRQQQTYAGKHFSAAEQERALAVLADTD